MIVNDNRDISQDGDVRCNLNAVVYAINCGNDIQYLQLMDTAESERELFNNNSKKFGLDCRMINYEIDHNMNHELWVYDPAYDNINLLDFFYDKCITNEQKERVKYEIELYEYYNMTKLLRCMIWLVNYLEENNLFWGVGRGSSVSSYCLFLLELHMVDSIKYDLDVNEFLKY